MTYVSTPRFTMGVCAPLLALALTSWPGCAKVTPEADGVGGRTSSNVGVGGGGGRNIGTGGSGVRPDSGANGDGASCQQAEYSFVPKIPNVLVYVDGSGSMFDVAADLPNGRWGALRSALLPVIMDLQDQVNFGLAIFSGVNPTECPIFQTVPIAPSNYGPIMAAYPAARLRPQSVKLESPLSLHLIPPLFAAAPKTGPSYVLLTTDGEPDFCNDANVVCPVDAAVAGLKQLSSQGITTIVMGLTSNLISGTCPGVLESYANAGAGLAIANPCLTHNSSQECQGEQGWKDVATQLQRPLTMPLVDYATTGGGAKVYSPNIADQTSLTNTLASLFSGVKSCTFDLGNINGSSIRVDTTQLNKAQVKIENTVVPLDNANGWRINCVPAGDPACKPSQLELTGSFCANWRMPNIKNIAFNFPCEIIVPG